MNILITVILSVISCYVGLYCMEHYEDSSLGFNGPAILSLLIGEEIWWMIKRTITNMKQRIEDRQNKR